MVANTPLQGQVDTYKKGAPIIYLVANGIDNLLNHSWLNPAPIWVNIIQITIISLILGFVWRFGVVAATLTIFTTWALLFWGHGYAFTFGDLFIPLSDTALFSSFALILGALWRLNADIKVQTEIKAKTSVKADLASLQSSFLDRFAYELAAINDSLKNRLKNVVVKDSANATEKTLLPRALESCEDFSEYLEGIKQSAAVEGRDHHRPQKSDVKVKTIVDAVLSRFETKIEEKKLQLKLSCPEGLSVYSDAKILDTIIYNLVSNAVKYSPKNSLIEITVETSGNSKVVFCVRDEGPGITPEHLEKIFEKFYRIKDEVVYSVKGTGLGLYLCRYFADQIDVKVWCESQPKKSWTRFFIEVEKSKT
jgi:signal transduction histidine kinase